MRFRRFFLFGKSKVKVNGKDVKVVNLMSDYVLLVANRIREEDF